MKNNKLFILSTIALFSLVGCGNSNKELNKAGELPSGGTAMDVTKDSTSIKEKLSNNLEATANSLDKVKVEGQFGNTNLKAKVNATNASMDLGGLELKGPVVANVELSKLSGDFSVAVEGLKQEDTSKIKVASSLENMDASLKATVSFPWYDFQAQKTIVEEETVKEGFSDLDLYAYYNEGFVYFDASDKEVDKFLGSLDETVNRIISDLSLDQIIGTESISVSDLVKSYLGEERKVKTSVQSITEGMTGPIIPDISEEQVANLVQYVDFLAEAQGEYVINEVEEDGDSQNGTIKAEFLTYKNGEFGLGFNVDFDIVDVDEDGDEQKVDINLDAAILFGADGLLKKTSAKIDLGLDTKSVEEESTTTVDLDFSTAFYANYSYGESVNLPDLTGYQEI